MSASAEVLSAWASDPRWQAFPANPRALGELTAPDGSVLLTLAFDTHRDIVSSIGYRRGEHAEDALCACAAALCSLAKDQAVMALDLLSLADIAGALGLELDDALIYQAVLAILCLKNALSSYADTRAADYAAFKQTQA